MRYIVVVEMSISVEGADSHRERSARSFDEHQPVMDIAKWVAGLAGVWGASIVSVTITPDAGLGDWSATYAQFAHLRDSIRGE